ncbi:MAG: anti-sigma factor [Panacagrimonas sp.]
MKQPNRETMQLLAAEFVLGTLRGGARSRFQRWMQADARIAAEVRHWEQRLFELSAVEEVVPDAQVWASIRQQMQSKVTPMRANRKAPAGSPRLWKTWAVLATAASLSLTILLGQQMSRTPATVIEIPQTSPSYIAAIRLPQEDAQWTVSYQPDHGQLRLQASADANLTPEKDYQLWWLTDAGVISLGLLPRSGVALRRAPDGLPQLPNAKVAVSLEPAGGSPDSSAPSGPVLIAVPIFELVG